MKNRNCGIWIAFACCACLVIAAMLWLTRSVIHTERDRAVAEIRAELQERVRLSLWRMDSMGASILFEENAIPARLFLAEPETALPVKARFETPDGAAIRGTGDPASFAYCTEVLPVLVKAPESDRVQKREVSEISREYEDYRPPAQSKLKGGAEIQREANLAEKATRSRWLDNALSQKDTTYNAIKPSPVVAAEAPDIVGGFNPGWHDDSLFLLRRGTAAGFAQGSLVDEKKLRRLLLSEALQLLPHASLISAPDDPDDSFILASFPFKLVPGGIGATAPEAIPRTISLSLLVGWLAAVIALMAAFFLIANVMKLSERRASFVSAVTHELRTPLTTFRLYSDMLATGAVREEKRATYLGVLSREADRLSHLVENVLAFSRIERGSARSSVSEIDLAATLESFRERFRTRLQAAGLDLEIKPVPPIRITLDVSALEHILFNLIDNAAKYAATSEPALVALETSTQPGKVVITIRDHGPGIPDSEVRRIFRPFHKSAKQAAESQPGVGLGLALSKRLASSMGGHLSCEKTSPGAAFTLTLPMK